MLPNKIMNISKYMKDVTKFSIYGKIGIPLIHPSPQTIKIAVTNSCNARCITCNYWKNKDPKKLSVEQIKDAILQAKEIGIKSVLLYGGEPLIRGDIFELIEHARGNDLRATIITNGLILDERRAEKLVKSGISHITVSIHGREEIHDRMIGIKGGYQKAVNGARLVGKYWELHRNNEPLPLMINSLITKMTFGEDNIMHMIGLCQELGAQFSVNIFDPNIPYFDVPDVKGLMFSDEDFAYLEGIIQKLIDISKKKPYLVEAPESGLKTVLSCLKDPKNNRVPCIQGFLGPIFLDSDGGIHACSVLKPLGDIRKDRLKDVVFSKEWQKRAENMYHLKCPKCFCGYYTRIRYYLPFYWKDIVNRLIRLDI